MKSKETPYNGIYGGGRIFHWMCKLGGLVPYSVISNLTTDDKIIDINLCSNVGNVMWSLLMFSTILGGLIFHITIMLTTTNRTPADITIFAISRPMSYIMTLLSILSNLVINRQKIPELFKKLTTIYKSLHKYAQQEAQICTKTWINCEKLLLCLIVIPFIVVEAFLCKSRMTHTGGILFGIAHLIQLLYIIQFYKLVLFVHKSLKILNSVFDRNFCYYSLQQDVAEDLKIHTSLDKPINIIKISEHQLQTHQMETNQSIYNRIVCSCPTCKFNNMVEIRQIYRSIYDTVEHINSMYGLSVLLELIRNAVSTISSMHPIIYIFVTSTDKPLTLIPSGPWEMIICICWIMFFITREITITVFCNKATLEAKEILSNVQLALLHQPQIVKVVEQMKQFSTQIVINEIKFTASGFFTVNLSTLSAFLATITTYIVVLIQTE
jgi:hypothetical protein